VVERPVYNLTVFKVHFRRLTVKAYSKGERALQIEAIAHNADGFCCGKRIDGFPWIVSALQGMLERFLSVLRSVDASWVDDGTLEALPLPGTVGATRVGGVGINKAGMRTVMAGVVAMVANPSGFVVAQRAAKVCEVLGCRAVAYRPRHAYRDLKKLRAKAMVFKVEDTRRYKATPEGLRTLVALCVLREKAIKPLLARARRRRGGRKPRNRGAIDVHYEIIQIRMQDLYQAIGLVA